MRDLPLIRELESPAIVRVCDRIRSDLEDSDDDAEFCWFIREYPRCYRFHLDGADFRLQSIHRLLGDIHRELAASMRKSDSDTISVAISDSRVEQIYWDFEDYLSHISIALDFLARIVGPSFRDQRPVSFSRLLKALTPGDPFYRVFSSARDRWINRLKDYRDCFTHYTPVDTVLSVSLGRRRDDLELRAKLPTNPNARDILGFRYSRRVELFAYASALHRHVEALDRAVANEVKQLYQTGQFPLRRHNLFLVGRRERPTKSSRERATAKPKASLEGTCG